MEAISLIFRPVSNASVDLIVPYDGAADRWAGGWRPQVELNHYTMNLLPPVTGKFPPQLTSLEMQISGAVCRPRAVGERGCDG
jgi:hypothetical protein